MFIASNKDYIFSTKFQESLYNLDKGPLTKLGFINTVASLWSYLSMLLLVCFKEQKFVILMKFNLSFFSLL